MLTLILIAGLVVAEPLPPLEEPKVEIQPVFKCEHGFVHELVPYFQNMKVWVHLIDKKTGKRIDCNDI